MLRNIAPEADAGTMRKARTLRRTMTLPEALLWRELRARPAGLKFRRQHPTGRYVLDFFCSDARMAIEIDGVAHDRGNRPTRDLARDGWMAEAGIETLRIPAREVLKDVNAVAAAIVAAAWARLPLHHPAAPGGPPPRDKLGED